MATKPASWAWASSSLSANAQTRIGYGGFLLPMWENTGSNLKDLIGGSTTFAALAGAAPPTWDATVEGVSLDFPGVSSRVDFATIGGFGTYCGNGDCTIYTVLRCGQTGTRVAICADRDFADANWAVNLEQIAANPFQAAVTTDTVHVVNGASANTSSLFTVVMRYDSVNHFVDIDVNGTSATPVSTTATALANGTDFTLGRSGGIAARFFVGDMLLFGASLARWTDTDVDTFAADPFDLITNVGGGGIVDRSISRGLTRGIARGLSNVCARVRDVGGLWLPKDRRLVIPVGASLQGAR